MVLRSRRDAFHPGGAIGRHGADEAALDHGADPKLATDNGDTALTVAGGIGWVEGVTYERSPKENLEAMRMLLDLGLDPNGANATAARP